MEALLRLFRSLAPVRDDEWSELRALVTLRTFAPQQFLLSAGAHAEWCFFLRAGLVRELYIDDEGNEHTRRFLREDQVTGSLLDLLSNKPSVTWIQALEESHTLAFRYQDFRALCERSPNLQRVALRSAEELYIFKTKREHELLARSAYERYLNWLEENPGLDSRVSRRHLASYLGISPEHLSRLRREHQRP